MTSIKSYISSVLPSSKSTTITPALTKPILLSTASSIITQYPSITSAYLFGSYAKGTARDDSDVDIVLFSDAKGSELMRVVGGVHMDLEEAFKGKEIDLSVCPPEDFVQQVAKYWVKIDLENIPTIVKYDAVDC